MEPRKKATGRGPRNRTNAQKVLLKSRYGVTQEWLAEQLRRQRGRCGICRKPMVLGSGDKNDKAHVDHCHDTLQARGLLCNDCNLLLGRCKDSVDLLISAILYLLKHR